VLDRRYNRDTFIVNVEGDSGGIVIMDNGRICVLTEEIEPTLPWQKIADFVERYDAELYDYGDEDLPEFSFEIPEKHLAVFEREPA
jgi:hypothetical protein